MINVINIIWLKMLDLMEGSLFFRLINRFMDFIFKVFSKTFIYGFFTLKPSNGLVNNNIISKILTKIFTMIKTLGEKTLKNPWHKSLIGSITDKINVSEYLSGSLFFRFLTFVFGIEYKGITVLEIGIIVIIFLAPFIPTMVLVFLVLAVTFLYLFRLMIYPDTKIIKIDLTGIFVVLFIAITVFFGATSLDFKSSINISILTSVFMLFYLLVYTLIDTREKFETVMFVFATSALFVGLYGLFQQFSGFRDTTWVDKNLFEGLKLRVYSTFENPNVYGEYLLMAIPICFAMVVFANKKLAKVYYLLISCILLGNLGLTYSRGCYIAIVLALLIGVMLIEKKLIVFCSILIFALPFILPQSIINRIFSVTNMSDSSTSYRIMIWQSTLLALKDFWYVGIGQGGEAFNKVYPIYSFNSVTAPHSHSVYLQIFMETGITGLLCFIGLILAFFKTNISKIFELKNKNATLVFVIVAFTCGIIGFLFQGFFDYVFYNYRVFLLFFIIIALANSFININTREE